VNVKADEQTQEAAPVATQEATPVATPGARVCPFCPGAQLGTVVDPGKTSYVNMRLAGLGLANGLPGSSNNLVAQCPSCGFLATFHRPAGA
jgi:hypothetical protein